ncbi:MAG TPA: FHA domain-containing protein [Thermoanaerobaculia bacterium]|jgi:DNA-binding winged helix-turn-helix (wHTH) protein|nr:FHA domain-containing protein [Thermoanaerobaculia bacterium]
MTDDGRSTDGVMTEFRFGEFTFDCASRRLLRAGEEQHLSPKAQHLLRLLLLRTPCALSREELYDALWPSTFVAETNLAGIVNELRRSLGDDSRCPRFVRTVHSYGYAFCGDVTVQKPHPRGAFMLLCEGRLHPLHEGGNIVGRSPDADVTLTHSSVSRRHARITVQDGDLSIDDLDSKNGTFVRGRRVTHSEVSASDMIEFGGASASLVARELTSTAKLKIDVTAVRRRVAELGRGA